MDDNRWRWLDSLGVIGGASYGFFLMCAAYVISEKAGWSDLGNLAIAMAVCVLTGAVGGGVAVKIAGKDRNALSDIYTGVFGGWVAIYIIAVIGAVVLLKGDFFGSILGCFLWIALLTGVGSVLTIPILVLFVLIKLLIWALARRKRRKEV